MKLIDTIEFTPKTSVMYNVDRMWTEMLLRTQERHINDFMRKHGYIYLNQIYEMLAVKWNPDVIDNAVCIYKEGRVIRFDIFNVPEGFVIDIMW